MPLTNLGELSLSLALYECLCMRFEKMNLIIKVYHVVQIEKKSTY